MTGVWYVIGISGVTCGGKSSLTSKLRDAFTSSITINQDDYFLDPNDERHSIIEELNHANWEILSSLDMEKLVSDVNTILNSPPKEKIGILIVEGILIMNYKPLADLLDQKFYLTLTKEECRQRRNLRSYDPPDPHGYFDLCVWPMYEKHYKEVATTQHEIVFLNGIQTQDEIFQCVHKEISNRLTNMNV